jgi:ABC-type methionine transport system ATPase subunit
MNLLSELNRTQGTTLIVVTHNHEVARATRRIITLRDGKVQHDVAIGGAFDGDLYDFKSSALGQAVLRRIVRDFESQARRTPDEAEIDEKLGELFASLM